MKTIRVHVPDRSDFMLYLITNHVANFSNNHLYLVDFAKSADYDFSCNRLAFQKKTKTKI